MYILRAQREASPRTRRDFHQHLASILPAALLEFAAFASPTQARAAAVTDSASAAAFTAYSEATSGTAAPRPDLHVLAYQPSVATAAPVAALGTTLSLTRPSDASTGLFLAGPVSATVSGGTTDLRVGDIINQRTTTSGPLTLDLVATISPPPVGAFTGALLASAAVGTVAGQTEIADYNSGSLGLSNPTAGCYYLSLVLLENGDVVDVRTLPAGGTPENTGYSEFSFGGQSCPAASSCTRNSNTVCLDSSRFQVTVAYNNSVTGAGVGQVLLFGSTRAESDESGFYYFTDPANFELGVKVLDACSFSNFYWVFIGGLTNQGWTLNVLDTLSHATKTYGSADGVTIVTTTDTAAFPCT